MQKPFIKFNKFKFDFFCFCKFIYFTESLGLSPVLKGIFLFLKTWSLIFAFIFDILFLATVFLFYFSKAVAKRLDKRIIKTTDKATDFAFKNILAPIFKILLFLATVIILYVLFDTGLLKQFLRLLSDVVDEYFGTGLTVY